MNEKMKGIRKNSQLLISPERYKIVKNIVKMNKFLYENVKNSRNVLFNLSPHP